MMTRRRSGEECSKAVRTSSEISVRWPMYPNRKPFGFALGILCQAPVLGGLNHSSPFHVVLLLAFYYPMHNLSVPEQ